MHYNLGSGSNLIEIDRRYSKKLTIYGVVLSNATAVVTHILDVYNYGGSKKEQNGTSISSLA